MTEVRADKGSFPAAVVRVIDDFRIVINRGAKHGIKDGQRFLVYHLDTDPIMDPETGQDLGPLEIVRGTGTATHVQEKLTTVSSDRKSPTERRQVRRSTPYVFGQEVETITVPNDMEPFDDAETGDKVKPI